VQEAVRADHDRALREKEGAKCPKCKGSKVAPQLTSFMAQTWKKR
jgi:hypothetical protein